MQGGPFEIDQAAESVLKTSQPPQGNVKVSGN
jgi:hypothetical protein